MDIKLEKDNIIKRFEKINDIDLIKAVKSLLDFGLKRNSKKKKELSKFFGIMNEDEANEFDRIINDGCENIDKNEW
ncbi:MAG: hypothetical protein H6578_04145 [Chitinophagales bacterium]|nr:hypothetical protein [Chitinophagales bacterium]